VPYLSQALFVLAGNYEYECYTDKPSNAGIVKDANNNGLLSINAIKSATAQACNNGPNQPTTMKSWTSAKLTTKSKR
jgi:hypothetical protein